MNFRTSKIRTPDINMTPLVDVILQLVLFFMVTTQFAVVPGLKLELPSVDRDAQIQLQSSERLEIIINEDGQIFLEDEATTIKLLTHLLERTGAGGDNGDDVVILISADVKVPYGQIIEVMDTLRQNNFNRIVFGAKHGDSKEK